MADKEDFRIRNITRDKQEHYIMIKEAIIDVCSPNNNPRYVFI